MNGLTPADIRSLADSFINLELIVAGGIERVTDERGAEIVGAKRKAGVFYSGLIFPYLCRPILRRSENIDYAEMNPIGFEPRMDLSNLNGGIYRHQGGEICFIFLPVAVDRG